ncbi:2-hydroxyacid dehydrogenase [Geochorda subterranea]|uniref:2-hydroxyacid dehydrogenase n=1 Tax=Geochorda subterranea TaxID=3109564 RepID=A0ABZ1BNZ6_9FIRM|nr:2-hydroxyacid dehydrogenase [Limnochorda sp. LNt]WRP13837.1 2-hydroxyacid dehydrogenase [Limnochorda sp. LNt]
MKLVAILPASERLVAQTAMLQAVLSGHETVVVTSVAELEPHLPSVEVLVSTPFTPITEAMLAAAPKLRFLQVAGVGVDHVDLDAARRLGITVANVAGANAVSVAEHVVMAILALMRGLVAAHEAMRTGEWPLARWMATARDLAGRTVGIVGMGRIGREVAARLLPFGVALLYHDVRRVPAADEDALGVTHASLDDLLASSDVVTLHLPLTPETRNLLDRERLGRMKPGALLVNTARAELVDEAALVEALGSGRLGGAAIDVFAPEPPPPDHPLRRLPNVLLTPHGAGVTAEAQERIAQGALTNVLRFLDGHSLADVVVEGHR